MSEKNGLKIAQEKMMKAARKFKFENCEKDCYANEIWNAAIEAAIEKIRYEFVAPAVIIKMLKELKK